MRACLVCALRAVLVWRRGESCRKNAVRSPSVAGASHSQVESVCLCLFSRDGVCVCVCVAKIETEIDIDSDSNSNR